MQEEKRRFERTQCGIDSSFKSLEGTSSPPAAETVVQDISEGGIRFRTNHFIPVHHRLLFRINVPNQKMIEAVTRPAWIREIPSLNQYDIGAEFISLSDGDREVIRQFAAGMPSKA